jgi:hypothetical protein
MLRTVCRSSDQDQETGQTGRSGRPYLLKNGPLGVVNLKIDPNSRERSEDVRKKDDTIRFERVPRLQRDFHNQLCGL